MQKPFSKIDFGLCSVTLKNFIVDLHVIFTEYLY